MKLWEGTNFEQLSDAINTTPILGAAYQMGVIDQTLAEMLGVQPDDENVPHAAREVAAQMMQALQSGQNIIPTIIECAESIRALKGRAQ